MSSHCNRYPQCGCGETVGTKCHVPEIILVGQGKVSMTELVHGLESKEVVLVGAHTTPYPAGREVEEAKLKEFQELELKKRGKPVKPKRKHGRNYTPPKKRRK